MSQPISLEGEISHGEVFDHYYSTVQDLAEYMIDRHFSRDLLMEAADARARLWTADLEIATTQVPGQLGVPVLTTHIEAVRTTGEPHRLLSYTKTLFGIELGKRAQDYRHLGPSQEGQPNQLVGYRAQEKTGDYVLAKKGLIGNVLASIGSEGLAKGERIDEFFGHTLRDQEHQIKTLLPMQKKRLGAVTLALHHRLEGINDILGGASVEDVLAELDSYQQLLKVRATA